MRKKFMSLRPCILAASLLALVGAAPAPSPYDEGVAARHAGDIPRAVTLLERAAADQPENADAHLQLGYALLAAGRLDEAEAAFQRTLAIAPAYADASEGLALVARRRATDDSAKLAYRFDFNVEASVSSLNKGREDWKEGAVELRYRPDDASAVGARIEQSQRFGRNDTYGELRYDRRVLGGSFYLLGGGTPDADFRPRWQVGAGGSVRVRSGANATLLTADARHGDYQAGDVQMLSTGIEQYVAGGSVWFTGRLINTWDEDGEHSLGWLGRGDWQAREGLRLFLGYADAPDTSEGRVVDTRSLFGGFSSRLSERITLSASAAREWREDGSRRTQLGVGLGHRF